MSRSLPMLSATTLLLIAGGVINPWLFVVGAASLVLLVGTLIASLVRP